jgi:hypothetical protein
MTRNISMLHFLNHVTCLFSPGRKAVRFLIIFKFFLVSIIILLLPVLRIRRIQMFLGLPDPDPLVRRTDPAPDPSIIKQNKSEKP